MNLPKIDLSVQVNEGLGGLIVPWTAIEFHENRLSFGDLLSSILNTM